MASLSFVGLLKSRLLLPLALISLISTERAFGFDLFGEKWFEPPTVTYFGQNGPRCCLSKNQQERLINNAKNAWPILRAGTGSGVIIASWAKLDGITLGVAKEKLDVKSCETCGGNFFQKILDYTVKFNNSERWEVQGVGCKNGYDLQGVATHEFGHAIGLAHSRVKTATMVQGLNPCVNFKSTLDPDDLKGHAAIYNTKCGERRIGNCSWIKLKVTYEHPNCFPFRRFLTLWSGGTYLGACSIPARPYDEYRVYEGTTERILVDPIKPKIIAYDGSYKVYLNSEGQVCAKGIAGSCTGTRCGAGVCCVGEFTVEPRKTYCFTSALSPPSCEGFPSIGTMTFALCE